MGELAHQQAQMRLVLLAAGHVDRGADQAGDVAGDVAQRLDMEVVPVHVAGLHADADVGFAGGAGLEHRPLELGGRDEAFPVEHGLVGVADDAVDFEPRDRIADRGIAQATVLGEHGDLRLPQGELIALQCRLDLVAQPALLALQRAQPGDVDRRAGDALDLAARAVSRLDMEGVDRAALRRHVGNLAILGNGGRDHSALGRDDGVAFGRGEHLLVGASEERGADAVAAAAQNGAVAQVAVLEEDVHPGGAQRSIDAGDLVPYRFGAVGHALVDVPPEQGIQAPREDARHLPISLDAFSPPAGIGEELNSSLQSNDMKGSWSRSRRE